MYMYLFGQAHRHSRGYPGGKGEIPPPAETEKNVVENGVISEGSISSNIFFKIKIQFFYRILIKNFNIFSRFPKNLRFPSKGAKKLRIVSPGAPHQAPKWKRWPLGLTSNFA